MTSSAASRSEPLVARSVAIDAPEDLLAVLPEAGISWVRRGEGMIAWGEVARVSTTGKTRVDDAWRWFRHVARNAVVRDEVGVRGSGLVAFGSFSFSADSRSGGALIIPRYVVGLRDGVAWLTAISDTPDISAPSFDVAFGDSKPPRPLGSVTVDHGARRRWQDAVTAAVQKIESAEVDKVVLARAVDAHSNADIDVRSVLTPLAEQYPSCWTFHVDGMLGATPELLARVDRGLVTSRVLAGTIRPTGNETADLAHAAALAKSSKDREEHEYAVDSVTSVLREHCSSINVPEAPSVIHLPNVMHLASDVTGVLADTTSSLELVDAVHPSAAVCGTPTERALAIIDELESLDRSRYAGPVGWTDGSGDGEWCLALRAAELDRRDPKHLRLFAGCGIVAASDPADEWAESEAKLEPLRMALGL